MIDPIMHLESQVQNSKNLAAAYCADIERYTKMFNEAIEQQKKWQDALDLLRGAQNDY